MRLLILVLGVLQIGSQLSKLFLHGADLLFVHRQLLLGLGLSLLRALQIYLQLLRTLLIELQGLLYASDFCAQLIEFFLNGVRLFRLLSNQLALFFYHSLYTPLFRNSLF